jgi:hypothetical protein
MVADVARLVTADTLARRLLVDVVVVVSADVVAVDIVVAFGVVGADVAVVVIVFNIRVVARPGLIEATG